MASGSTVAFTVTAAGNPSPTFQWYVGNSVINGATSSTLTLSAVRPSDAGDYSVVVTNPLGAVTSSHATLTVSSNPTTPPPSTTGSGGGGAPSVWFFLALAILGAVRRWVT